MKINIKEFVNLYSFVSAGLLLCLFSSHKHSLTQIVDGDLVEAHQQDIYIVKITESKDLNGLS